MADKKNETYEIRDEWKKNGGSMVDAMDRVDAKKNEKK